jgi:cytochrome b involved in lipid metabolism
MSQTMEKHFSSPAFQKAVDQQRKEVKGRKITMAEVAQHKGMMDMWIVVRGQVFDCTKYASSHPGGRLTILRNAGGDATKPFDAEGHSFEAVMKLAKLFIGDLVEQSEEEAAEAAAAAEAEKLAQEAATAQRARQLQEESARKQARELQATQRAEEEARQAKAAAEAQAQAQAQAEQQRKREQAALLLAQQQKQAAQAEAQRRHDEAAIHAQRQAALRQAQEKQRQAAQQQDALDQKNKADLEASVVKSAATPPSLQISSILSNAPDFGDEDDECGTPNAVQLMR